MKKIFFRKLHAFPLHRHYNHHQSCTFILSAYSTTKARSMYSNNKIVDSIQSLSKDPNANAVFDFRSDTCNDWINISILRFNDLFSYNSYPAHDRIHDEMSSWWRCFWCMFCLWLLLNVEPYWHCVSSWIRKIQLSINYKNLHAVLQAMKLPCSVLAVPWPIRYAVDF